MYINICAYMYLFQSNETISSNTNMSSYLVEVQDDEHVLNTSQVLSHSESVISKESIGRKASNDTTLLQSSSYLETNQSQNSMMDSFCEYFIN